MMAAVVAAMALVTVIGSTITASASPRTAKKIIGIEQAKEATLKAMKIKERMLCSQNRNANWTTAYMSWNHCRKV